MIFISHSSKDKELVVLLNTYLLTIGLNQDDIFCSSINGQDVNNGCAIDDYIHSKMKDSDTIIYLITHNFISSGYCASELGAGWMVKDSKNIFLLKTEDVNPEEMKGFINSNYKYSKFNSDGLSELYDLISEKYNLIHKQAAINSAISDFLTKAKSCTSILLEEKEKSKTQLEEEHIKALEKQYENLPVGAKKIIAEIYFSDSGIKYYTLSNGVIGSLTAKLFIRRTTNLSTGYMLFAFELQPWVISFIKKNKNVKNELEKINKSIQTPREPSLL